MSVIIIYMFIHCASCKDIDLCEPSVSADLVSISEVGQEKKVMLGIMIIIKNASVHPTLRVAWRWLPPCQAS